MVLKRTGGFSRAAVSYLGMAACTDLVPTKLEPTNKKRDNDINMQKIPTVYCCEVEAVEGGGGLTPKEAKLSLDIINLQ